MRPADHLAEKVHEEETELAGLLVLDALFKPRRKGALYGTPFPLVARWWTWYKSLR